MACDHEAMHPFVDENGENPAIVCRYCDWSLGGFRRAYDVEVAIKMLEMLRMKPPRYMASWER